MKEDFLQDSFIRLSQLYLCVPNNLTTECTLRLSQVPAGFKVEHTFFLQWRYTTFMLNPTDSSSRVTVSCAVMLFRCHKHTGDGHRHVTCRGNSGSARRTTLWFVSTRGTTRTPPLTTRVKVKVQVQVRLPVNAFKIKHTLCSSCKVKCRSIGLHVQHGGPVKPVKLHLIMGYISVQNVWFKGNSNKLIEGVWNWRNEASLLLLLLS